MSKMKDVAIDQRNAEKEGQLLRMDGSVLATIDFEEEYVFVGIGGEPVRLSFEELSRISDFIQAELISKE
jgi:hypothetical protein